MIYTITFNPAVDYVVHTDTVTAGAVNRSSREEIYFGGKGINISVILNELKIPSAALGFIAGFTGEAIKQGIEDMGIKTDFIQLQNGFSRINVKIKSECETEINGHGPKIEAEHLNELFKKLDNITDGDTLVLAGSVPSSLPPDIYEKILEHLKGKQIRVVADTEKALLLNILKFKPFLIKPNHIELGEIFNTSITTVKDTLKYAAKLQEKGAENVLVSMAQNGAVLLDKNRKSHICPAYKGTVKNSVGAGDSMVAGFLAGCEAGDFEYALKLGTAAGGATAFSDGLATGEMIKKLLQC